MHKKWWPTPYLHQPPPLPINNDQSLSSLSCSFNRCICCLFSVVHDHRLQQYTKCRPYQKLFKINWLHIVIKSLNEKINMISSLLCWSVTLLMFTQTLDQLALQFCQKWEPAGRIGDFGNFFNGFAKCPRLIVLNIDWVQFVLKNCELVHSVRGLYDR